MRESEREIAREKTNCSVGEPKRLVVQKPWVLLPWERRVEDGGNRGKLGRWGLTKSGGVRELSYGAGLRKKGGEL